MLMAVGPVTRMSLTPYFFSSAGACVAQLAAPARLVDGAVWPAGGITWISAVSPPSFGVACGDRDHAGELADRLGQLGDGALGVGAGDDVGGHRQRRVVALAERRGDRVVGLALRGRRSARCCCPAGPGAARARGWRRARGRPTTATTVTIGTRRDDAHPAAGEAVSRRVRPPAATACAGACRRGFGRSRSPSSSAIAGSSVSAISTATVTAAAAARPITVSTGIRRPRARPAR